jgi:uncharacterized protein YndB with AHSA1/START domain
MSATLNVTTPTERELVMTRVFNAPCHLVFDALTKPELIRRWYGPVGWSMVVCEIDLRVDGAWSFVSRRPDGKQIGQRGVYREIVAPERLVNTESWEDWNPGELLVTTILVEHAGTTTLTMTSLFPSQEVRDMLIKSGMTSGAAETYDKLAACLASMV